MYFTQKIFKVHQEGCAIQLPLNGHRGEKAQTGYSLVLSGNKQWYSNSIILLVSLSSLPPYLPLELIVLALGCCTCNSHFCMSLWEALPATAS